MKKLFTASILLFISSVSSAANFTCVSIMDPNLNPVTSRAKQAGTVEVHGYFTGNKFAEARDLVITKARMPEFSFENRQIRMQSLKPHANQIALYVSRVTPVVVNQKFTKHILTNVRFLIDKPDSSNLSAYQFSYSSWVNGPPESYKADYLYLPMSCKVY